MTSALIPKPWARASTTYTPPVKQLVNFSWSYHCLEDLGLACVATRRLAKLRGIAGNLSLADAMSKRVLNASKQRRIRCYCISPAVQCPGEYPRIRS